MVPDLGIYCKLKEIASIYDGTHQTPEYKNEGIPFVIVENINDIYDFNKYISKSALPEIETEITSYMMEEKQKYHTEDEESEK